MNQTGNTYSTTIADNSGSFEKKNIELISNFVELKVDGYYFNEISGKTSGPMTLYALVDVDNGKGVTPVNNGNRSLDAKTGSANVNVLTHLEKLRVEYLVKQEGKSFSEAKQQAQREVLAIFGFEPAATTSDALNLTDDAVLLAISCILQGYLSTGDMMELMAKIRADIETDGVLDNSTLGSQLINNAKFLSLPIIRANLEKKYGELDISVVIPKFEDYVQQFIENKPYQQTELITYPELGEQRKKNILCLTENILRINNINSYYYPMKAELPQGMSLRIVLKGFHVGYLISPMPLNWSVLKDDRDESKEMIFEVTENGKPNNTFISFDVTDTSKRFTIEYYENGAVIPTRIKEMVVVNTYQP